MTNFASLTHLLLAFAAAAFLPWCADADVSCGGHSASSCAHCGGEEYCNGECLWKDGKCVYFCGAKTCADCRTKEACAGQCSWDAKASQCRGRTASVHLNYNDLPVSKPGWWFQRVVLQESSSVSFYAMNAHEFGYGGVQQLTKDPFKGRVIFSLWDQDGCDQCRKSCVLQHPQIPSIVRVISTFFSSQPSPNLPFFLFLFTLGTSFLWQHTFHPSLFLIVQRSVLAYRQVPQFDYTKPIASQRHHFVTRSRQDASHHAVLAFRDS